MIKEAIDKLKHFDYVFMTTGDYYAYLSKKDINGMLFRVEIYETKRLKWVYCLEVFNYKDERLIIVTSKAFPTKELAYNHFMKRQAYL